MRVLTFDFIEDSRFGGSERELIKKDRMLKEKVNVITEGKVRELHFSGEDGNSTSWRKRYYVARNGETWNDTMAKINRIQAPFYKFVRIGGVER